MLVDYTEALRPTQNTGWALGMHRIFGHRKWPKSAFSVFGRNTFITETIRPKCCDDANRNRDLHVLVWSNMSAVWTYFSISEKDPRTAICKTCNAEISRGGASAKTFSTSGLIYHLKSKHSDHYAEYERNAAQKRKTPPSTPTPSVADGFEKARTFPSDIWAMAVFVLIHYYVEGLQRKHCCIFKQLHLFWMHFLVVVLQRTNVKCTWPKRTLFLWENI